MRLMMVIVVGWLAFSTSIAAQGDWAKVQALGKDQTIRVRAVNPRSVTGTLLSVDDTSLALINEFGNVAGRFTRDEVLRVERLIGKPRSKTRGVAKGLAWGALAGLGLSIGPMFAGAEQGIPYVFAVTLGAGAGIGALRAQGRPASWSVVYRR